MESNCTTSDGSSDQLSVPEGADIEWTPSGGLVFMKMEPGVRELIGFVDVSDWQSMTDKLRKRGIAIGAIHDEIRFPRFQKT